MQWPLLTFKDEADTGLGRMADPVATAKRSFGSGSPRTREPMIRPAGLCMPDHWQRAAERPLDAFPPACISARRRMIGESRKMPTEHNTFLQRRVAGQLLQFPSTRSQFIVDAPLLSGRTALMAMCRIFLLQIAASGRVDA